ncbi:Fibronectin type III domain protein [Pseudomonas chlororaphis]|nr:Fibronectin type III domain protein [Pseudomonas chlororaphis]
MTTYSPPVAAGAACDRVRSARQTSLRADPGRSRTQDLRLLSNRSQPRGLGSGYTDHALQQQLPVRNKESRA